MTADTGVRRSLCCICGTLRTVSASFPPRGRYTTEGDDPSHIAQMQQGGGDFWRDRQPWRRCLENLKCATCGRVTEHAMVPDAGRRDIKEEQDRGVEPDGVRPSNTEKLAALGIKVFRAPGMGDETGYYLPDHNVAFINADLSPEDQQWTAGKIIDDVEGRGGCDG